MLYLNPPFHIIEGVSVFADHADPRQYYYLPLAPRLTVLDAGGDRVPQIQLIKYRGQAGNGGFLNFDVNVGVDQEVLDDVTSKLATLADLDDTLRLAPVPLVDGSVKLLLFGHDSGAVPSEEEEEEPVEPSDQPEFVLKMSHHAKPSLYGDNQATFSVQLDQYGVTVMEKALMGEMSPIGIVYSLDFLGLRPAYSVRVTADWDRVQKHLDENFGVNTLFFEADINTVVDELVESRAIVIEADTFIPEGEDDAVLGRRDQAMNEVREMVTDTFFQPSLEPIKEERDGWDKFADTSERISNAAARGGQSAMFTYSKVDMTRIDRKSLNVNMSERTTVKRSIYPQGHLAGLVRFFRDEGIDPARFILDVDLDSDYFKRRKVTAISRANFDQDSIASIDVELAYGSEKKSVLLEASDARGDVDWASILTSDGMEAEVTGSYKVSFRDVDGTERPISLTSESRVTETEHFEVNPREIYTIVPIPITPLSFPWERYPNVEVETRYLDEANGIRIEDHFLLKAEAPESTWQIFVLDPAMRDIAYRITYRAADLQDVVGEWVTTTDEFIPLRDPIPNKRSVDVVVPSAMFVDAERVFVDLSYEDPDNAVLNEQTLEFAEGLAGSQSFVVDLKDPTKRRVAYTVNILFKDGRTIEIPRSYTSDRRIMVRADMKGHRIVTFRPAGDMAPVGLREIRIEARYVDDVAGLSYASNLVLKSDQLEQVFEFDYVDPTKPAFEYKLSYFYENGLTKSADWTPLDAEEVAVPVG